MLCVIYSMTIYIYAYVNDHTLSLACCFLMAADFYIVQVKSVKVKVAGACSLTGSRLFLWFF